MQSTKQSTQTKSMLVSTSLHYNSAHYYINTVQLALIMSKWNWYHKIAHLGDNTRDKTWRDPWKSKFQWIFYSFSVHVGQFPVHCIYLKVDLVCLGEADKFYGQVAMVLKVQCSAHPSETPAWQAKQSTTISHYLYRPEKNFQSKLKTGHMFDI